MAHKLKEVTEKEVAEAVKRMVVRGFDGRPIDWETIDRGLVRANFEIKQMALFAPPIER